jgi:hypothetical protein
VDSHPKGFGRTAEVFFMAATGGEQLDPGMPFAFFLGCYE